MSGTTTDPAPNPAPTPIDLREKALNFAFRNSGVQGGDINAVIAEAKQVEAYLRGDAA